MSWSPGFQLNVANTAGTWFSAVVTVAGLTTLITQTSAIKQKLDPFYGLRGPDQLGYWSEFGPPQPADEERTRQQQNSSWWKAIRLNPPPPEGPILTGNRIDGLCGKRQVFITRRPKGHVGKANWTVVLVVFHPRPLVQNQPQQDEEGSLSSDDLRKEKLKRSGTAQTIIQKFKLSPVGEDSRSNLWENQLQLTPLVARGGEACTNFSRTALILLLLCANCRLIYRHSGAAGHRAAYAGYNGLFTVAWPLEERHATVHFSPHDSHTLKADVYPPSIPINTTDVIDMAAGIVCTEERAVAFAGRPKRGGQSFRLIFRGKGFGGQHGSRHLYNMMGGDVYKVDFLGLAPLKDSDLENEEHDSGTRETIRRKISLPPNSIRVIVPSVNPSTKNPEGTYGHHASIFIPPLELSHIAWAMDHLPWSNLSFSMHRGMRSLLVAVGAKTYEMYRNRLALELRDAVNNNVDRCVDKGWEREFAKSYMGDMVYSSIEAESGSSGDLVRVFTAALEVMCEERQRNGQPSWDYRKPTNVWARLLDSESDDMSPTFVKNDLIDAQLAVALVKYQVLAWSQDFDYQMYHDLPMTLLMG